MGAGTGAGLTDIATVSQTGVVTELAGTLFGASGSEQATQNGYIGVWALHTTSSTASCAIVASANEAPSGGAYVAEAAYAASNQLNVTTLLNGTLSDMPFTLMVAC
jgi:hypothetical protein